MEEQPDDFSNQQQHFAFLPAMHECSNIFTSKNFYLGYSHPHECEVLSHFGFDLHYHESWWFYFSRAICLLYIFFGKILFRSFAHFKIGLSFTFELWYFCLCLYDIHTYQLCLSTKDGLVYLPPTVFISSLDLLTQKPPGG